MKVKDVKGRGSSRRRGCRRRRRKNSRRPRIIRKKQRKFKVEESVKEIKERLEIR